MTDNGHKTLLNVLAELVGALVQGTSKVRVIIRDVEIEVTHNDPPEDDPEDDGDYDGAPFGDDPEDNNGFWDQDDGDTAELEPVDVQEVGNGTINDIPF